MGKQELIDITREEITLIADVWYNIECHKFATGNIEGG